MKKLLITLLLPVFLSGCLFQRVYEEDYLKGVHFCKDKEGVLAFSSDFTGYVKVFCKNGEANNTRDILLPKNETH